jgi:hypothetical protein
MEHQKRYTHLLNNQSKKNTQQNLTPNEVLQRRTAYDKIRQQIKQDPDKEKEKTAQTGTPENDTSTINTPVGKQTKDDTPPKQDLKTEETVDKIEKNSPKEDNSNTPTTTPDVKGATEISTTENTEGKLASSPTTKATSKNPKKKDNTEPTKSAPAKAPSGGTAPRLPNGDELKKKEGGGKKLGGGDDGRLIDMTKPELAGNAQRVGDGFDSEQGQPLKHMTDKTKEVAAANKKRVDKTAKAERHATPAVLQVKQAKEAEEIKQADKDAEAKQGYVETKSKADASKADKTSTNAAIGKFAEAFGNSLPKKAKDLEDEKLLAGINERADAHFADLSTVLNEQTQGLASNTSIDSPTQGDKPKAATPLPALLAAQDTPLVDANGLDITGNDTKSIAKASTEARKEFEKEGIGTNEIPMSEFEKTTDKHLSEANKNYRQIEEESTRGPEDVQKLESNKQEEMRRKIKDKEQKNRSNMRQTRDEQLKASRGQQGRAKSALEQERAKVTQQMEAVFERARLEVSTRLQKLDTAVKLRFNKAKKKAMTTFEENVNKKLASFKTDRYVNNKWNLLGPVAWGVNLARWALEDTSELPEVIAIFDGERQIFVQTIDKEINAIIAYMEGEIAACKKVIDEANKALEAIVKAQGPAFKKVAKDAYKSIRKKLDTLNSQVDKKAAELKKYLEAARKKAIEEVDKKIAEIKERLKGLLHNLAKFLVDAAYKFFKWVLSSSGFSTEQIDQIINQGKQVLTKIVTDPMGFFQNVIEAVGQGFNNFVGNIGTHLKNGFFAWLTGAMTGVGLNLPKKWDLKGIFSVVLQVMGLDWTGIRAKIAKEVGEENLARAEEAGGAGLELLQQIKEKGFVDAVWDMLVEKAESIKEMVISEIQNWLITSVVKQAIIKILSMLNPAGAIVQAILAIYDFAMWLINNWERIVQIIQNIVSSIGKIAMGQLGDAAKFIENTLANFVPMLLDFLARLLRLGNVSEKIKKILQRVRKPIDDLLAKIMTFIKNKIKGFGKKGKKKKETKDQTKKDMKKDKGKDGVTDVDRKKHREIGEEIERELKKPVKKAKNFDEFYQKKTKLARKLEKRYQRRLKKGIKVKISFGNLAKEKKDNDIDFRVRIAPNTFDKSFASDYNGAEDKFDKILFDALKRLGNNHYGGYKKKEIMESEKVNTSGNKQNDSKRRDRRKSGKESKIKQLGNIIHQKLSKAQIAYSNAARGEYYPNNTFKVGPGGDFFVCQINNYYIVPHDQIKQRPRTGYEYFISTGSKHTSFNKIVSSLLDRKKKSYDDAKELYQSAQNESPQNPNKIAGIKRKVAKEKTKYLKVKNDMKGKNREQKLKFAQQNYNQAYDSSLKDYNFKTRAKVGTKRSITKKYWYRGVSVKDAKNMYKNFPNSITSSSLKHTVFIASVVVEPSRHTAAHITNMLLLDERSKFGKAKEKNVKTFKKQSMTQGDSDPNPIEIDDPSKGSVRQSDSRLNHRTNKVVKIVSDRDLAAVKKHSPELHQKLKKYFETNSQKKYNDLVEKFTKMIQDYLDLP